MFDIDVMITGGIGIITTIMSGWTSWFFARKKYNSEVDSTLIENMENSLEFYKKLSDDNRARLEQLAERNLMLETELQELRKHILNLSLNICMNLACEKRIKEGIELNIKPKKSNGKNKDRFDQSAKPSKG